MGFVKVKVIFSDDYDFIQKTLREEFGEAAVTNEKLMIHGLIESIRTFNPSRTVVNYSKSGITFSLQGQSYNIMGVSKEALEIACEKAKKTPNEIIDLTAASCSAIKPRFRL